jgi:Flp pilus assembly protein TadG
MRANRGGARRGAGRSRGAAAVELALTLPLLVTIISGLWELGRAVEVQQILFNASREAARQAATGKLTAAQVQAVAASYVKFGLNDTTGTLTSRLTVTVVDLDSPASDPTAATTLDRLQVTVSIPFSDVRWINLPLVTNASTVITSQAIWACMVDLAYPSTTPQPPTG